MPAISASEWRLNLEDTLPCAFTVFIAPYCAVAGVCITGSRHKGLFGGTLSVVKIVVLLFWWHQHLLCRRVDALVCVRAYVCVFVGAGAGAVVRALRQPTTTQLCLAVVDLAVQMMPTWQSPVRASSHLQSSFLFTLRSLVQPGSSAVRKLNLERWNFPPIHHSLPCLEYRSKI